MRMHTKRLPRRLGRTSSAFSLARCRTGLRAHGSPEELGRDTVKRRTALLSCAAVASAVALGSLFGGVFTEARSAGATAAPRPRLDVESALSGFGRATARRRRSRSSRPNCGRPPAIPTVSRSSGSPTSCGGARPGTPRSSHASERALARALAARPNDATATLGLGSLALTRHEFRRALELGREARRLAPSSARPLGVIGDALVELGRYPEAFARVRAHDRRSSRTSPRTRGSPTHGSSPATRRARSRPCGSRSTRPAGVPEPTAWAHVELAKLELGAGPLGEPSGTLRAALTLLPGYVFALEQLARVEAAKASSTARSRSRAARRRTRPAAAVRRPARRPARARRRPARGAPPERDGRGDRAAAGVNGHPRRPRVRGVPRRPRHPAGGDGRARAPRRAPTGRPSTATTRSAGRSHGRDAASEALPWLGRSLRLGTQDALLFFHRGYAEGCAGNRAAMRDWYGKALALNPQLLGALVARRAGGGGVKRLARDSLAVVAVAALRLGRIARRRIRSATSP